MWVFALVGRVGRVLSRRPWLLVALGVALVAAAAFHYAGREPICGDRTMVPGDRCRTGERITTYEEEVADQSLNKWIVGGLGALALGRGAYVIYRRRRPPAPPGPEPGGSSMPPPPPHPPEDPPRNQSPIS